MKYYLLIVLVPSYIYAVDITFQVDMREQNVSMYGVHIAGSNTIDWNDFGQDILTGDTLPAWDPGFIELTDDDFDGIYSITLNLIPDYSYEYKFINGNDWGFDEAGNRSYTTSTEDTILEAVCFNSLYLCSSEIPLLTTVEFRVDMKEQIISESGVYIAGSQTADFSDFGFDIESGDTIPAWNPSSELCALSEDPYNEEVYTISLNLIPGYTYEYKFINGNQWGMEESIDNNRSITVSPVLGITATEVCFGSNEDCPDFIGDGFLSNLTFTTDVSNAVADNGFDLGDTLVVKWGYGGTQSTTQTTTLEAIPFSYEYTVSLDSVGIDFQEGLYYQYYHLKNNIEYREVYFNFEYSENDISLAERRFIPFDGLNSGDAFSIIDAVNSNVDSRRMPTFRNTDPIGQDLTVTWTVDLRPAYYQVLSGTILEDIQGMTDVLYPDSVLSWGVWINGPATEPSGESWTSWGSTLWNNEDKKMWDDGTHGDIIAGDSIYSVQFTYNESATIGQEFKFGIKGGDNESGYGLNHIANIDINNPIVHSYWGSINPIFYSAWDYDSNTSNLSIETQEKYIPEEYYLGDNYPNPFNPRTEFEFSLPERSEINISIYNISGNKITELKSKSLNAGTYKVKWNGEGYSNTPVPSGIYFYVLKTATGINIKKKMTLIK